MEYSVCTASILMSVLECIVSVEINMFILISSGLTVWFQMPELIWTKKKKKKSINDRVFWVDKRFWDILKSVDNDHSADPLCIHFQSVNIMIEIGYFPWVCILKAYVFICHSKWCIGPQSQLFDGTVAAGWGGC